MRCGGAAPLGLASPMRCGTPCSLGGTNLEATSTGFLSVRGSNARPHDPLVAAFQSLAGDSGDGSEFLAFRLDGVALLRAVSPRSPYTPFRRQDHAEFERRRPKRLCVCVNDEAGCASFVLTNLYRHLILLFREQPPTHPAEPADTAFHFKRIMEQFDVNQI